LQKTIRGLVECNFEFRNTRSATKVVIKDMDDFSAIKSFFKKENLSFFTFHPKSLKPIKAVIQHIPSVTPAEGIYEALTEFGFDVMSVKQMTSSRRSLPEAGQKPAKVSLPIFIINLNRKEKSQEIFKLTGLCHISVRVEAYKISSNLTQCHNCQQFGHVWANCNQPLRCMWCEGGHLHKENLEKGNAASYPACCNCKLAEGKKPHPSNYRGCSHAKEKARRKRSQIQKKTTFGRVFSSNHTTPGLSFAAAVRKTAEKTQQPTSRQPAVAGRSTREHLESSGSSKQQETGQSVQASRVHRPPKVIVFNANGIGRQRYELHEQDLHIDVALLSETHLKPHERFSIPNYNFYFTDRHPGMKGGTAVAVRKGIPHSHVDLPPLMSTEATGVSIPIGSSEILLAAVYRCPGRAWVVADITQLLCFRKKCILAGDLNAKHPFWNSRVSKLSGEKLLNFFDLDDFEISAPQCPAHYFPAENGDVMGIVVHRNIRLSNVMFSAILDSDHLPIVFHILDHVRMSKLSEPTEKFKNWERFQSLAADLISPRIEMNSGVKADTRRATSQLLSLRHTGCRPVG
jgi:hypothetical protein